MHFSPELHAQSVLQAWIDHAIYRAKDARVKKMDFEHTPMNPQLLRNLETMVRDQEGTLELGAYLELLIILGAHQKDFLNQGSNPNALFGQLAKPVPVPTYPPKLTYQDSNTTDLPMAKIY